MLSRLRGNSLLTLATALACVAMVLIERSYESRVIERLNEAVVGEDAAPDDWTARWESQHAAAWFVSRGMPERGFERLAAQAIANGGPPRVVREAVQIAAAEEARRPALSVGGRSGLARLDDPRWSPLRALLHDDPGVTTGHSPHEGLALWVRREYSRAGAIFAEVLTHGEDILFAEPGERARACFLYADTLKTMGQDLAAERYFAQLGHLETPRVLLSRDAPPAICDVAIEGAPRWVQRARAELIAGRSLALDVQVDRRGLLLSVDILLDRDNARRQLAELEGRPDTYFRLPGAAVAGLRVNDRFLADREPERASLTTLPDGTLRVQASYRFTHDDPALWRNGPVIDSQDLPDALPLELVLPLWAMRRPAAVSVRGDAVRLRRTRPLPTDQGDDAVIWAWGPESPLADRPLRVLVELDLGAVNMGGILLPIALPGTPKAAVGFLMSAVVLLTGLAHVLRRRERPWVTDRWGNVAIDTMVAGLLAPAIAIVAARPLWFALRGGQPFLAIGSTNHLDISAITYGAVGVICATVLAAASSANWSQVLYLRRLGCVLFAGYLTVWFGFVPWWQILIIGSLLAPPVWFFWLAPKSNPLVRLTSAEARAVHLERDSLLEAAFALRDVQTAEATLTAWPAKIAEGRGSVEDFEKARASMAALRERLSGHLDGLRRTLKVEGIPVTDVVLGVGPGATPLRNALAALAFGFIPTLFITLGTGRLEAGVLLANLAFFGLVFRWLRGTSGLEKAVSYGVALSALMLVPGFSRVRTPVSLTAILVEALLTVSVLMVAGVLMDAVSTRRRWRTLARLYDAPTVTRLFGGTAAAATAAAAGLFANGSSEVIGLLWAQVNSSFVGF